MLSDDDPAAMLIRLDDETIAYACHTKSQNCASCGNRVRTIPAMLLYRAPIDLYEVLCRECALVVVRAAQIRMDSEDGG